MQHDVDDLVLAALATMVARPPRRGYGGLEVTPFDSPPPPDADTPVTAMVMADLAPPVPAPARWAEESPPRPRRVRALNPGSRPVVVDAGTLLDGGMSARAVSTSVVLPPGAWTVVAVEPVGARWWDEGRLWWRGRLDAVTVALVLQGVLGEEPASASARTAAWSIAVPEAEVAKPGLAAEARAWLVSDGSGVVAAWVAERGGGGGPSSSRAVSPPVAPAEALDALADALAHRRLVSTVVPLDRRGRDLVVIPRDTRLVDAVLRTVELRPPRR